MRQILKRFGIYLLVLAALLTIFNSWPPLLPSGTSGARLGHYAGQSHYKGVPFITLQALD